jgi:hypothetical protein
MSSDPFLASLSSRGQELFIRSFLGLYRNANWDKDGQLAGNRQRPVVSGTVRSAASSLAATMRHHHKQSPFHQQGSANLRPALRALLRAFENTDPAPQRQKAITPKFLRCLFDATGAGAPASPLFDTAPATTADLAIGGFFFAVRSCEYSKAKQPGKTKIINLAGVLFRDNAKRLVKHDNPHLGSLAEYVTITFVEQKCGEKMDCRTQQRTGDLALCPVLRYVSVVQRIRRLIPDCTGDTTINTIKINGKILQIDNTFTRKLFRDTCSNFGGKATFGFDPHEIGNKSLRSGAAMSLFLQHVSGDRIMILGRWASRAFLDYIRPQVLEWTNNMSRTMIQTDNFLDAPNLPARDEPRPTFTPFNGPSTIIMPRFHLYH